MENGDLILTIDFGTQSVRASIFDAQGNALCMEKETYAPAYFSPKPGYAEQDPDYYYQCLCKCTNRIKENNPELLKRVKGITETCFRDSAVLLDKERNVVRPMILWLDQRFAKCEKPLPWYLRAIFGIVGMGDVIKMNRKRTIANWIIENEPENWAKVDKYVAVSTYFIYRLTGQLKDSAANCTGHYPIDFKKKKWYRRPEKHMKGRIFSVKSSMLCELVKEGGLIGTITKKCSLESGIPTGVPVFACGSDKSCETLGVGVMDDKTGAISLGTACTFETTVTKYTEPVTFLPCYPSCIDGYYNMDVQIYRGYWMINWFLKEFGGEQINDITLDEGDPQYWDKQMANVPVGSDGLILQPYWGSMLDRPEVKGSIVGFSDVTTRAHFYRALIEGIGYALREAAEGFQKKLHHKFTSLRVSGGGAKSNEICQIMADIFGVPVSRVHTTESSSLGAAMAGFLAIDRYETPQQAIENMVRLEDSFKPNMENHKVYDDLFYGVYMKLYPDLKKEYKFLWNYTAR